MRSWVRGKRAWSGGGEREKTYSGVLAQALLGDTFYWDDIPPKGRNDELGPLGACHKG